MLLYLSPSSPSSILSACCKRLNSSFSYTTFLVRPNALSGLPRKLNTAWVSTFLDFVILPLALSPSVIKMVELFCSTINSSLFLEGSSSFKCTLQSLNFLLCRFAFLARSLASFLIPASSLRSLSLCSIRLRSASATAGLRCKKLSSSLAKNSSINFFIEGPPSKTYCEPNLVFVWLSKTGSCTRTETAATILVLISETS